MSYLADKLEGLDQYFEQKNESEKWFMILLFAFVIAYVVYDYSFASAKALHDQSIRTKKTLTKKIHEEEVYLSSISMPKSIKGDRNHKVKVYTQEIERKKASIVSYNKRIGVINSNLNKLSDLLFNQKNWSLFLNSITERASGNGIQINTLRNKYVDNNGSFGHVLEISLNCEGDFENIIHFMNDLEQNTLVTDIYSSRVHSDVNRSTIVSDINISVWGVNH